MYEGPNRKGASPAIKNLVSRSSKLLVLNAFLSIVMCMTRFDYNIALSLGLLLYLEVHQNDYFEFFKPAGLLCLFFSFIDLIWIFMVYDCWLFTSPEVGYEKFIHSQLLVLRWITFVCSIVSLILKLIIGFGLLSSSKVEAYTGYVQLENTPSPNNRSPLATGPQQQPPKQDNRVGVGASLVGGQQGGSAGLGLNEKPTAAR